MRMKYKLESGSRLCQAENETEEQRQIVEIAGGGKERHYGSY